MDLSFYLSFLELQFAGYDCKSLSSARAMRFVQLSAWSTEIPLIAQAVPKVHRYCQQRALVRPWPMVKLVTALIQPD
jgi:hypothetical protein